jgi:hypothetical protein
VKTIGESPAFVCLLSLEDGEAVKMLGPRDGSRWIRLEFTAALARQVHVLHFTACEPISNRKDQLCTGNHQGAGFGNLLPYALAWRFVVFPRAPGTDIA